MSRALILFLLLTGCGGLAWNSTLADDPGVRRAMVASLTPSATTESQFITRWGRPTQIVREGGETRFIYRNMTNPAGYYAPQFGDSSAYVVAVFQYGRAVKAYSSDTEGCRGTFAPRPPGQAFDNPTTVHPVNCKGANAGSRPPLDATGNGVPSDDFGSARTGGTGQSGKL